MNKVKQVKVSHLFDDGKKKKHGELRCGQEMRRGWTIIRFSFSPPVHVKSRLMQQRMKTQNCIVKM